MAQSGNFGEGTALYIPPSTPSCLWMATAVLSTVLKTTTAAVEVRRVTGEPARDGGQEIARQGCLAPLVNYRNTELGKTVSPFLGRNTTCQRESTCSKVLISQSRSAYLCFIQWTWPRKRRLRLMLFLRQQRIEKFFFVLVRITIILTSTNKKLYILWYLKNSICVSLLLLGDLSWTKHIYF
jgi:hypothetical protein